MTKTVELKGSSGIQWTEETWNPMRGCALVSPGCANCYAMGQAHRFSGEIKTKSGTRPGPYQGLTRLRANGKGGPVWTGEARFVPEMLDVPMRVRRPTTWFVNSMSDLFHEDITKEQIAAVFGVMAATPHHTYQVLTKRAQRMREWFRWIDTLPYAPGLAAMRVASNYVDADPLSRAPWPLPNVWLGVSVEDRRHGLPRVEHLRRTPAAVRFLSIEPLLEDIGEIRDELLCDSCEGRGWHIGECHPRETCGACDGRGTAIDWIIVGGESGPGASPCEVAWIRSIVEQSKASGVPVFVKQLGSRAVWSIEPTGKFRTHEGRRQFEMRCEFVKLNDRKGGDPSEWPEDLRVREMPAAWKGGA